jgi:hypothetical protein
MKTILYLDGFNFYYDARRFGVFWIDPRGVLEACMLTDTLTDAQGTFHKPHTW